MKKALSFLCSLIVFISIFAPVASATSLSPQQDAIIDGIIENVRVRTYEELKVGNVTIPSNSTLVVKEENGNQFLVSYQGQEVWIDSGKVLVNIAEFIPSLEIDLQMAKPQNNFNMANETIEGLSNHQFYTNPGSVNGSEAWLKYEAAKKLLNAQQKFIEMGLGIIIYDAYRPSDATVDFRKAYSIFLSNKSQEYKNKWFGKLGESWFLAQKASSHNYGVAVDMGLRNTSTGEVLEMPSGIHTLDKRSAYYYWSTKTNSTATSNALLLKSVMESVGFTYLKSEWWHFQDNTVVRDMVINIPN